MSKLSWRRPLLALALLSLTQGAVAHPTTAASPSTVLVAQEGEQGDDGDSSEVSVDWHGVYHGLLPCADCEGVDTILILRPDHTYTLITRMLGDKVVTEEESGSFAWTSGGGSILLNDAGSGPSLYKVGENQVFQLDENGQAVAGPLAESYVLRKVAAVPTPTLEGTRWVLVELDSKPVGAPAAGGDRPYFVLNAEGGIGGYAGCNSFGGKYEAKSEGQFDLSELISTMRACPELPTEAAFLKMLEETDSYQRVGTSLFLYTEGTLVARLRAAAPKP